MKKISIAGRVRKARYHYVWSGSCLVKISRVVCAKIIEKHDSFSWSISKDEAHFYLSLATEHNRFTMVEQNQFRRAEQFQLIESNGQENEKVTQRNSDFYAFVLTASGWARICKQHETARKAMETVCKAMVPNRIGVEFCIGYHNRQSNRWIMVAASHHDGPYSLPFDTAIVVI